MSNESAASLAAALGGHPTLASLELWNVGLEDGGARARAALVSADSSNPALKSLNLGRNLFSSEAREQLEALIDASRVRAKMY